MLFKLLMSFLVGIQCIEVLLQQFIEFDDEIGPFRSLSFGIRVQSYFYLSHGGYYEIYVGRVCSRDERHVESSEREPG